MILTIERLSNEDAGDYYCHAENIHGATTQMVSIRLKNSYKDYHNITECCIEENISAACMHACGFFVDIDLVKDRPECLIDFDRLMKCAADNSDHQVCCRNANVPTSCLYWCSGMSIMESERDICAFKYTTAIIDCFYVNRERLPGIPQDLNVENGPDTDVIISWKPPKRNAHLVDGYRVYWQEAADNSTTNINENVIAARLNSIQTTAVDTKDLQIRTMDFQVNVLYEITAKAANQYGTFFILLHLSVSYI